MSESPTTTEPTETPENLEEMTRRQTWLRAKAIMKSHPIMDGSGHLCLKERGVKPTKAQVKDVLAYVRAGLLQQGFSEAKAKTIEVFVKQTLRFITRRGPDAIKPPPPILTEEERLQAKLARQERIQARRDAWAKAQEAENEAEKERKKMGLLPTLKATKPRTETRQVVTTVTVKKARSFHYPRDLPGGDA